VKTLSGEKGIDFSMLRSVTRNPGCCEEWRAHQFLTGANSFGQYGGKLAAKICHDTVAIE